MATAKRLVRKNTFDYYDLVIYAARNSQSARSLARGLKSRRWYENPPDRYAKRRPFFRGSKYPLIVNWGSTILPEWGAVQSAVQQSQTHGAYLNPAQAVAKAINKLETFKCLTDAKVPTLKWTTDKKEAEDWVKKEHPVFARKTLVGSSGAGISVITDTAAVLGAPLYTRNFPKTHEFRVHVFDGQVIDFVEKKRKLNDNDAPAVRDSLVRNHDNGWVFAHDNLSPTKEARARLEDIS